MKSPNLLKEMILQDDIRVAAGSNSVGCTDIRQCSSKLTRMQIYYSGIRHVATESFDEWGSCGMM